MVTLVLAAAVFVAMMAVGVLAYLGVFRGWVSRWFMPFDRTFLFGVLYGAVGVAAVVLAQLLGGWGAPVPSILLVLGAVGIATMLLSLVWLPGFLLPRWFREFRVGERERLRASDDARRELRRARRGARRDGGAEPVFGWTEPKHHGGAR